MSYSVEVVKDEKVWYGCSNGCWHFMLDEIVEALSPEHKPAIQRLHEYSHAGGRLRWYEAKRIAAALATVKGGVGIFSNAQDIAALARVFEVAAETKSSVQVC